MANGLGQLVVGQPFGTPNPGQTLLPTVQDFTPAPTAAVSPPSFGQQILGMLQDPDVRGAVLRTSLGLLQPIPAGQTGLGQFGRSVLGGAEFLTQRQDVRARQGQEERRTATAEERTEISREAQRETGRAARAREGLEERRLDFLEEQKQQAMQDARTQEERALTSQAYDRALATVGQPPTREDFFGEEAQFTAAREAWEDSYLKALDANLQFVGLPTTLERFGVSRSATDITGRAEPPTPPAPPPTPAPEVPRAPLAPTAPTGLEGLSPSQRIAIEESQQRVERERQAAQREEFQNARRRLRELGGAGRGGGITPSMSPAAKQGIAAELDQMHARFPELQAEIEAILRRLQ